MLPLDLPPDRVAEELARYQERLAKGLKTLARMDGIEVGASPREPVYEEDRLVLYRYRPQADSLHPVPLLIVYALVNRPYMADLQKGRSLVEGLLRAGIDVYLVDWGYPDRGDRFLTLDDYIEGYLHRCVEEVCRRHGLEAINVLGICQGGTFSLCYAALHPARVRNLVTMVTPVDFHVPGFLLAHLVRHVDVDLLVDALGNVPGELLNVLFLTLKPFRLTGQKYVGLVDVMEDPEQMRNFLRMEKWIFDSPDQAGEAFRQFVKACFQENRLVRGELELGGRRVDLGRITMPVLNIYATEDHLVPPASSVALERHVGTEDYTVQAFKGGHIGIYVSGRSQREVPPAIAAWLKER